jgi:DNA adenine methylase
MRANGLEGGVYAEPFAGGAGIAWELLRSGVASSVRLNDANRALFAFWHSVLYETDRLCRLVENESITIDRWIHHKRVLADESESDFVNLGFSFFFLNRCNRSGIISRGGVIGGLEQSGRWKMDARFNRAALVARVREIASFRDRVELSCRDALDFMTECEVIRNGSALVYIDPPYFVQGRRLYMDYYKTADHEKLARFVASRCEAPWVVSYDAVPEVRALYIGMFSKFRYSLQYSAARAYQGQELFVFSDRLRLPKFSSVLALNGGLRRVSEMRRRAARISWTRSPKESGARVRLFGL